MVSSRVFRTMAMRHVLLLTMLWAATRVGAGEPQPPTEAGGSLDSGQLLRLIVSDVTANIRPLVDQIASRIEGIDSRLNSFNSRFNAVETRLNALDYKQSSFNAINNDLSARLDNLTSRVDTRDNALESHLEEVASQSNSNDTEIRSRLEEMACQCNSTDTELIHRVQEMTSPDIDLVSRLDNLTSLVYELHLLRDCSDLPPSSPSGIYLLQLRSARSAPPVAAYCDQVTDGGGWTVIQRRADIKPRQNFNRTWAAYQQGFGSLNQEFWWGLENLWRVTGLRDRRYQLRVDLADFEGGREHAVYRQFSVSSSADGYRLSVGEYSGDAVNSLEWHNGQRFSTWDRDQDSSPVHCAQAYNGGWWFNACFHSHLNGLYLSGKRQREEGVNWGHWRGWRYSFKETDMKIRPINRN